jgi:hypothetical protein
MSWWHHRTPTAHRARSLSALATDSHLALLWLQVDLLPAVRLGPSQYKVAVPPSKEPWSRWLLAKAPVPHPLEVVCSLLLDLAVLEGSWSSLVALVPPVRVGLWKLLLVPALVMLRVLVLSFAVVCRKSAMVVQCQSRAVLANPSVVPEVMLLCLVALGELVVISLSLVVPLLQDRADLSH